MSRIMIVEDDKRIVKSLTIRLKAAGFDVSVAFDAAMAMTVAVNDKPDLAILDISMPAGNGFQVADRLQSNVNTAGIPMIFMTASKKPGLREQAEKYDAVGFFRKPYDGEELLDTVRLALEVESYD